MIAIGVPWVACALTHQVGVPEEKPSEEWIGLQLQGHHGGQDLGIISKTKFHAEDCFFAPVESPVALR